jgi:hypothetical protein
VQIDGYPTHETTSDGREFALKHPFRIAASIGALVTAVCVLMAGAPEAGAADTVIPISYTVNASTTLAKLHQTVVVPPGSFKGSIDLTTSTLTGNLALPPASTTVSVAGIGLATATFELSAVKPVVGKVDLSTLSVTATAQFNVLVTSVEPLFLPVNLVGARCGTTQPVSVTFSGTFSLTAKSTFSGTYTIPPLSRCGLATPALNLVIPGPGNVFNASFS